MTGLKVRPSGVFEKRDGESRGTPLLQIHTSCANLVPRTSCTESTHVGVT